MIVKLTHFKLRPKNSETTTKPGHSEPRKGLLMT